MVRPFSTLVQWAFKHNRPRNGTHKTGILENIPPGSTTAAHLKGLRSISAVSLFRAPRHVAITENAVHHNLYNMYEIVLQRIIGRKVRKTCVVLDTGYVGARRRRWRNRRES
jgi:hypothetical protein